MKQVALDLKLDVKRTRKREFLEQMEKVVPWGELVALITPFYPEGRNGRPPFSLHSMLRTHFLQQWFSLSDPAMEEAFFDTPLYREFAQLEALSRLPDESTILRFRHRLEKHKLAEQILKVVNDLLCQRGLLLKTGTVVDATLIAAPTSTKNKDKARDPAMHSTSDLVRIVLTRVAKDKALPFDMRIPNKLTAKTLTQSEQGVAVHLAKDADDLYGQLGI